MPQIGYEATLNLMAVQDALIAALADEAPSAVGSAAVAALRAARGSIRAALESTKAIIEAKPSQPDHPWAGKKVKFKPQPAYRAFKRDGGIVLEATWEYEVG